MAAESRKYSFVYRIAKCDICKISKATKISIMTIVCDFLVNYLCEGKVFTEQCRKKILNKLL